MTLNGFYNEETLEQLLYEGKITRLEYIYHHSQEMKDEFSDFCRQNNLEENDESAEKFWDNLLQMEEEAHINGLD